MIDKRLFQLVERQPVLAIVGLRLLQLICSVVTWILLGTAAAAYLQFGQLDWLPGVLLGVVAAFAVKILLQVWQERYVMSASAELKVRLRQQVVEKAFVLGEGEGQLPPSTLTQLAVEGIQQVEIYFSRFLPQMFYCLAASLLLFFVLLYYAWQPAVVLLVGIPMIPVVIMAVMKIAKRILKNYWGKYTDLGETFYENLQGFATVSAFDLEESKQQEMDRNAEGFRKITMKLLSMQLNSITIMDLISYGGAGLGIGVALMTYAKGELTLAGLLIFILVSAEVFIPMRQLGSLFHVAINGISATGRLLDYLDQEESSFGTQRLADPVTTIKIQELTFGYDQQTSLEDITLTLTTGGINALVGPSGSGKSTLARILSGNLRGYRGKIIWDGLSQKSLSKETLQQQTVIVNDHGYFYPTSIKENLLLAAPQADEEQLWQALEKVALAEEIKQMPEGLDTPLQENANDLSGGQRQRLLLAQGILKDGAFYLLDEITSGVDHESEEQILAAIEELAKEKLVLFISHRLYNVMSAKQVLVLTDGHLTESGTPEELLDEDGFFADYFKQEQQVLEGGDQDE